MMLYLQKKILVEIATKRQKLAKITDKITIVCIKSVYFSVELAFENKRKHLINVCSQSQTKNVEITRCCFWIWFADKHLQFLQVKHLQCGATL